MFSLLERSPFLSFSLSIVLSLLFPFSFLPLLEWQKISCVLVSCAQVNEEKRKCQLQLVVGKKEACFPIQVHFIFSFPHAQLM